MVATLWACSSENSDDTTDPETGDVIQGTRLTHVPRQYLQSARVSKSWYEGRGQGRVVTRHMVMIGGLPHDNDWSVGYEPASYEEVQPEDKIRWPDARGVLVSGKVVTKTDTSLVEEILNLEFEKSKSHSKIVDCLFLSQKFTFCVIRLFSN